MDFPTARRTGAVKYGKNKTKTLGYNFFETEAKSAPVAPAPNNFPISPDSPGTRLHHANDPIESPLAPSPTNSPSILPAHVTAHSTSPVSTSDDSGSQSPPKQSDGSSQRGDSSMFDVLTSGDEHEPHRQRPSKRRKLGLPSREKPVPDQSATGDGPAKTRTTRTALAKKEEDATVGPIQVEGKRSVRSRGSDADLSKPAKRMKSMEVSQSIPATVAEGAKTQNQKAAYGRSKGAQEKHWTAVSDHEDVVMQSTNKPIPERVESAAVTTTAPGQDILARVESKSRLKKPTRTRTRVPLKPAGPSGDGGGLPDSTQSASASERTSTARVKARTKKATYGKKRLPESVSSVRPGQDDGATTPDQIRSPPVLLSPAELELSIARTPRRWSHHLADSDTSAASPSQLGLKDLRLSPAKSLQSRRSSLSSNHSFTASPPNRGRARRIDLLDAPQSTRSLPVSRPQSASRSLSTARTNLPRRLETAATQQSADVPSLPRSGSSQTRQTYGRAKNTYGKERSHLADMVDNLDVLSNSSSQDTSQQLASQLAAASGPSQLQMELELEDASSDDGDVGGKLKSIHELRQAGTNNRFDRDLETLLEEIDPTSKGGAPMLRLQALIKLFTKMAKAHSFEAFVSDRALDRLASWSKTVDHKSTRLIFDMIFWRLVHTTNVTPRKLGVIASAVAASAGSINNLSTIGRIARDKKEKLSKIMLQDMQQLEEVVLNDKLLPNYEGGHIVPAAITLAALNDSLRKLAEANSNNVSIGQAAYEGVLLILTRASHLDTEGNLQSVFITKLALSLLQLFSGPLESDLGLDDEEYLRLGDQLASIVEHSISKQEDLVQGVLHFAISLCNDRPTLCSAMSGSKILGSLMKIIDSRFLALVTAAGTGAEIAPAMLDSIILSLACLLNLTEYDDGVRENLANGSFGSNSNCLGQLVAIYKEAAPQLAQAATAEQSQVLVAFGYLSLLICNLCLNDDLWQRTSQLLGTCKISDVVVSAKELLIHLRTLEMAAQLDGEVSMLSDAPSGAMDGFTHRFEQLINAVRVE